MIFRKKRKKTVANERQAKPQSTSSNSQVAAEASVLRLTAQDISLGMRAKSKEDAIAQVADCLIALQKVDPFYKDAMLAREKEVSTYLLHGVAIPHGVRKSLAAIKKSAVFIGQFPEGVQWMDSNGEKQSVYIVCALASKGSQHLSILNKLTLLIQDEAEVAELVRAKNLEPFLRVFNDTEKSIDDILPESPDPIPGMVKEILFTGENGMHERPAALLAKSIQKYPDTEVFLHVDNRYSSIRSISSLLLLNITPGTPLTVNAVGPDEAVALATVYDYIADTLNHEKADPLEEELSVNAPPLGGAKIPENEACVYGQKACGGMCIGEVFVLQEAEEYQEPDRSYDSTEELHRFNEACKTAIAQLDQLVREMESGELVEGQKNILRDESIQERVQGHIQEGASAPSAVQQTFDFHQAQFEALDERLKQRAADFNDVKMRLLYILCPDLKAQQELPKDKPFVLVASELAPSQMATLQKHPVLGIATAQGGATSHMAILARSFGIPSIVGLGDAVLELKPGAKVVLDGHAGVLFSKPSQELLEIADACVRAEEEERSEAESQKHQIAITQDEHRIDVLCNIASDEDAQGVVAAGGEGVGLLRTEFMFESTKEAPDVEAQYTMFVSCLKALEDKAITIRCLDIGGDKPVRWLSLPKEDNPFLGIRGIRLLLKEEEIFRTQLTAIYRAARWQHENQGRSTIKIMLPMVAREKELVLARKLAKQVQQELGAPELPIGIMVETPASAICAAQFAQVSDFFSIGSNDLTQYALAIDRGHKELSTGIDCLHPSVLGLIDMTVSAARNAQIPVSVCGNMASDRLSLLALLALGVSTVSLGVAAVADMKRFIRKLTLEATASLKQQMLAANSAEAVLKLLTTFDKELQEK